MLSAFTVIPVLPTTLNVLLDANVPPPVRPAPAIISVVVLATEVSTEKLLSAANVPPPLNPSPAVNVLPSSVVILAVLFVTVPPMFASSFNASESSLSVLSVAGAPLIKLLIAVSTYAVLAALVELSPAT